jgi:hypothetical protein
LLDKKVVCSKPCHGMNLVSAATRDYLCNPCTGFHRCYSSQESSLDLTSEEHAFTVGSKNVGLTFDALTREHVVVEIFYNWKDFKSRQYDLTCTLRWCRSWNPARSSVRHSGRLRTSGTGGVTENQCASFGRSLVWPPVWPKEQRAEIPILTR